MNYEFKKESDYFEVHKKKCDTLLGKGKCSCISSDIFNEFIMEGYHRGYQDAKNLFDTV